MKGTQIILKQLIEENVDTIFGYPGGTILPLYDELSCYKNRIRHILTAHEQGATHAADGYARSTGKTGVVFCTSGPGVTNTITGITTAYKDSVPIIVITTNISSNEKGYDNFQEVDIIDITKSITKQNFKIENIEDLQITIKKAFKLATTGRTGPVLIDISKNVLVNEYEYIDNLKVDLNLLNNTYEDANIEKIINLINESKKPILLLGGGIVKSNSTIEIKELANKINSPVVTTLMGIDSYPKNENKNLGLLGIHGQKCSNIALLNADLIIGIGTRFSERTIPNIKSLTAKIIHIDIDKHEINKRIETEAYAIGNIKNILQNIIFKINKKENTEWLDYLLKIKNNDRNEDIVTLNPKLIIKKLQEIIKDPIIVTDVGLHQIWAAQASNINLPRHFITSGGLGTMGFGLGAAIGCKIGNPNKNVILITGDGSFNMNMNELATCRMYNISLTIFLMNNGALGMVKEMQKSLGNNDFFATNIENRNINYNKLMEAYNFNSYEIRNNKEIEKVIKKINFDNQNVNLINCLIGDII